MSDPGPARRRWRRVTAVALVVGLVATAAGVIGIILNADVFADGTPSVAPSTDPGVTGEVVFNDRLSIYRPTAEEWVTDEDTGATFVGNEVLVMFLADVVDADARAAIAGWGGTVVGHLTAINRYEMQLPQLHTMAELQQVVDTVQADPRVEIAYLNRLQPVGADDEPDDPAYTKPATGTAGVKGNWGLAAINAPEMWDYADEILPNLDTITVGIDDGGFAANADVKIDVLAPNQTENHGTHVAGIIGASFNNGDGATGVVPGDDTHRIRMYGISEWGLGDSGEGKAVCTPAVANALAAPECHTTTSATELAMAYLVGERHVSVVNRSMGFGQADPVPFAASRGNAAALASLQANSDYLLHVLNRLLSTREFLVVTSAGNSGEETTYARCKEDCTYFVKAASAKYGYRIATDTEKKSAVAEGIDAAFNSYYAFIGSSFDQRSRAEQEMAAKVRAHILVVGAMGKPKGAYAKARFTSYGERTDLWAPGVQVESTIGSAPQEDWDPVACGSVTCALQNGTSMASPYVAGAAAALWAMNPKLTGDQVRQRLLDSLQEAGDACVEKCLLDIGAAATKLHDELASGAPGVPAVSDTAASGTTTAMVFDVSGSMSADSGRTEKVTDQSGNVTEEDISKMDAAIEAGKVLLRSIRSTAQRYDAPFNVGVSTFSDSGSVEVAPTTDYEQVAATIEGLSAGGGTNLLAAIRTGSDQLGAVDGSKVMILLSDGKDEAGNSDDEVLAAAQEADAAGIKICTVGFGESDDVNETLLKGVAEATGCNYSHADASSAVALAGSFIAAQMQATSHVLGQDTGSVGAGQTTQSITLDVPNQTGDLTVVLYSPSDELKVQLKDADGTVVDAAYAGVTIDDSQMPSQLVVTDPSKGSWTLAVNSSGTGEQPYFTVAGFAPIEREYQVNRVPELAPPVVVATAVAPTPVQIGYACALGLGVAGLVLGAALLMVGPGPAVRKVPAG